MEISCYLFPPPGGVKYTVLLQRKLFEDNQPEHSCVKIKGVKVPSAPEKPAMGLAAGRVV